jgi:hypothetical protein
VKRARVIPILPFAIHTHGSLPHPAVVSLLYGTRAGILGPSGGLSSPGRSVSLVGQL